jgi:hypothetical protein
LEYYTKSLERIKSTVPVQEVAQSTLAAHLDAV